MFVSHVLSVAAPEISEGILRNTNVYDEDREPDMALLMAASGSQTNL